MDSDGQPKDDHHLLQQISRKLKFGYAAKLCENGRLFYLNHGNQTSSWLPPLESWDCGGQRLPYGWEAAVDKDGKSYYINHVNKTTTYEDPHNEEVDEVPQPREIFLVRDLQKGFGFVAGSEKPVIVRFVTEGGPSIDKLLPGDQILKINGKDVKKAPRDHVIELVRSCKESISLVVCQPYTENQSARKSALLSAAKKAKLKVNPSRVRFAEGVVINESPLFSPSDESCIPFMPNVLKVFLENGQTKSFKYDNTTTVRDVLKSLQEKLSIKCIEHFSLMVEHIRSLRRNKLRLLNPKETLARIAARPGAQHLRCLFRVTFVPRDAYELLRKDAVAFEYLYVQCCNDVVQEKFAPELKYDIALRLAAFQIQQHGLSSNIPGKLSIKAVERETGLERFVPTTLVETMKRKELRKVLSHFLKVNQNLSAPGQKHLTALQAKLHYLKIISELPSYGAKCFSTNLRDSNSETVILVSPKFGISQISGIRNSVPLVLAQLEELSSVSICREDELSRFVEIRLKDPSREPIIFSLEDREANELALLLQGYYRLLQSKELPVDQEKDKYDTDCAPVYYGTHKVNKSPWSYITDSSKDNSVEENLKAIDLTVTPPRYLPSDKPPETNKIDASAVSGETVNEPSASASKMDGSTAVDVHNHVDNNMNKMQHRLLSSPRISRSKMDNNNIQTNIMETYDNVNPQNSPMQKRKADTTEINQNSTGFDYSSVISFEVLESVGVNNSDNDSKMIEAKNDEVIKRVSEMEAMVQDAESYLTTMETSPSGDECSKSTDTPRSSDSMESEGTLKPADSLTLLTQDLESEEMSLQQVIDKMGRSTTVETEPSESDTDSHSTPSDSPSRRLPNGDVDSDDKSKRDSSFGLHSPDNLIPAGVDSDNSEIQDLLQKIQNGSKENVQLQLPLTFTEGALYLDPDIIDLTMIPPPITPDKENTQFLPSTSSSSVNAPPTPFADRSTLEAELRAMTEISNTSSTEALSLDNVQPYQYVDEEVDEITKQLLDNGSRNSGDLEDSSFDDDESDYSSIASSSHDDSISSAHISALTNTLARLQMENAARYSIGLRDARLNSEDLESFIASVTIPPPPSSFDSESSSEPSGVPPTPESFELLSQDDIKAYIIPPPPSSADNESVPSDTTNDGATSKNKVDNNTESDQSAMNKKKSAAELLFPDGKLPVCHHSTTPSLLPPPRKRTLPLSYMRTRLHSQSDGETSGNESLSSIQNSAKTSDEPATDSETDYIYQQIDSISALYSSLNDENSAIYASFDDATSIAESIPQHGTSWNSSFTDSELNVSNAESRTGQKPDVPPKNLETFRSIATARQKLQKQAVGGDGIVKYNNVRRNSSGSDSSESGKSTPTKSSGIPRSNTSPSVKQRNSSSSSNPPTPPPKPRSVSVGEIKPSQIVRNGSRKSYSSSSSSGSSAQTSPRSRSAADTPSSLKQSKLESPRLPRTSQKPPLPPTSFQENGKNGSHKHLRSPSPARRGSAKSKTLPIPRKNTMNGTSTNLQNGQALTPPNKVSNYRHAGLPKSKMEPKKSNQTSVSAKSNGDMSPTSSVSKLPRPKESNSSTPKMNGNEPMAPLQTSSPKVSHVTPGQVPTTNGTSNSLDECLNHSFDDDSLEIEVALVFHKAGEDVASMILNLDETLSSSPTRKEPQQPIDDIDMAKYIAAKDTLAMESRQFVTASKLFVKSVSESTDKMVEHLTLCVKLLERIFEVSEMVAHTSSSHKGPHLMTIVQMQDLVSRVKEVAFTFMQTVQAASDVVCKGSTNPTTVNLLMQQATALATVLTSFMRNLKTYSTTPTQ